MHITPNVFLSLWLWAAPFTGLHLTLSSASPPLTPMALKRNANKLNRHDLRSAASNSGVPPACARLSVEPGLGEAPSRRTAFDSLEVEQHKCVMEEQ